MAVMHSKPRSLCKRTCLLVLVFVERRRAPRPGRAARGRRAPAAGAGRRWDYLCCSSSQAEERSVAQRMLGRGRRVASELASGETCDIQLINARM